MILSPSLLQSKISSYEQQHAELKEKIKRLKKEETGSAKVGDNGLDPGDEASQSRIYKNLISPPDRIGSGTAAHHAVYTGKPYPEKVYKGRIDMPENPWQKVILILMSFTAEGMFIQRG